MAESLYNLDIRAERIVGKFLEKYFYPNCRAFTNVKRCYDRDSQYAGIDVSLYDKDLKREILIDEKTDGHYFNSVDLTTFVLELSYHAKDDYEYKRRPGWFVNDNLKTDMYLFSWVSLDKEKYNVVHFRKSTDYFKKFEENDIHSVVAILCSKQELQNYFAANGYDKKNLDDLSWDAFWVSMAYLYKLKHPGDKNYADCCAESKEKYGEVVWTINPKGNLFVRKLNLPGTYSLFCSFTLAEKPVTVSIERNLQLSFAHKIAYIRKDMYVEFPPLKNLDVATNFCHYCRRDMNRLKYNLKAKTDVIKVDTDILTYASLKEALEELDLLLKQYKSTIDNPLQY